MGQTAYREQFTSSPAPQAVCDEHGVLTEVNEAFGRLVGLPASELTGRPVRELCHRSDPGAADRALDSLLAGRDHAVQTERVLRRRDGRPVPTLVSATALHDEHDRPAGAAAVYQDLTMLHRVDRRRQRQEDFFLAMSQRASDVAVVLDPEGRILFASPALTTVLGHSRADVVAEEALRYVHPDDVAAARDAFTDALTDGESGTCTLRVRAASGDWRWMELSVQDLLDTVVGGVAANLRDVTERKRAQAELHASERRFRAIADHAQVGLWAADPAGRTTYVNQRVSEILGRSADELEALRAVDLGTGEVTYAHPSGAERVLVISSTPLDDAGGAVQGSLAVVSDVTDAHRLERDLRNAALHDSLTRLPNRALLLDRLTQALTRSADTTAVLLLDVDHFRLLNDTRGQQVGDALLVDIAVRLTAAVRPVDTVARFGGDEFVIVCEDVDEHAAREVATAALEALQPPFRLPGGDLRVGATIGLALGPAESASALLQQAEGATYDAKLAGRGGVRVFDPRTDDAARRLRELGAELARALSADEPCLHYQPVIDLATGRVSGVEALARWDHHRLGPVPPSRFVAAAEEGGLAPRLDRWVVRRATHELARLRSAGVVDGASHLAVNLSARTLSEPSAELWITEAVAAAELAPTDVVLEVTESATMTDPATAAALLERLRERGFQVAIDDFGTGHNSLAHLRRLPVSVLKIDRSFVAETTTDAHARAITGSIVELARAMGLTVVAEGVESPEHVVVLRRLGVDAAQGWLWSPAVSPEEAARTGALCRCYSVDGVSEAS